MKISRSLVMLGAALMLLGAAVSVSAANTFVDLKANFYFSYPDEWIQVDHRIVDMYLAANKAGETTLDYEAAFAPATQVPFYSGAYFILTVDAVPGGYTDTQIDSILTAMSGRYGEKVKYFPVADFLADMKSNQPSYDANRRIITVVNDIVEKGQVLKKHLLVEKFFDEGIAHFFFYAPVDSFANASTLFNQVLDSFHSGDVDSVLPKETLKVADIKMNKDGSVDEDEESNFIYYPIPVFVILIIILIARKRRREKEQTK